MINSGNAAAIFFATWFGVSIIAAPVIGRLIAASRRREEAARPAPKPAALASKRTRVGSLKSVGG